MYIDIIITRKYKTENQNGFFFASLVVHKAIALQCFSKSLAMLLKSTHQNDFNSIKFCLPQSL